MLEVIFCVKEKFIVKKLVYIYVYIIFFIGLIWLCELILVRLVYSNIIDNKGEVYWGKINKGSIKILYYMKL